MKKHVIQFLDPTHHAGLNSTCRLGVRDYAPGDCVVVQKTGDHTDLVEGEITAVYIMPFWRLTKNLIKHQHAKDTRDMDGLYKAMERAYGKGDFDGSQVVTLVQYWIPEEAIECLKS